MYFYNVIVLDIWIMNYQGKKMQEEEEKLEDEKQRLTEMEKVLKEQALKDAER